MVQEWLTAIGETEYDAEHREGLLWEELREAQSAMDGWHRTQGFLRVGHGRRGDIEDQSMLDRIDIARELCDVAYVAIGTALLRVYTPEDQLFYHHERLDPDRWHRSAIEGSLYKLFQRPQYLAPIRRAAAYYGFGDKLEDCFAEVHRANMRKLECDWCCGRGDTKCAGCHGTGRRVSRAPDDCILKPAGWQPPELGKILFGEMEDKTNG